MPFLKYNTNPVGRRGNDCTIRAISLFTGKTWDEVYIGVTAEVVTQEPGAMSAVTVLTVVMALTAKALMVRAHTVTTIVSKA